MTAPEPEQPTLVGGELNAVMATEVVRLLKRRTGRGPTLARAFFRDNVFVVVLEQTLTQPEQFLSAGGDHEAARTVRDRLNRAMRAELVTLVEEVTGARVHAVMAASEVEPDFGAFIFVLDRRIAADPVATDPHRMRLVE